MDPTQERDIANPYLEMVEGLSSTIKRFLAESPISEQTLEAFKSLKPPQYDTLSLIKRTITAVEKSGKAADLKGPKFAKKRLKGIGEVSRIIQKIVDENIPEQLYEVVPLSKSFSPLPKDALYACVILEDESSSQMEDLVIDALSQRIPFIASSRILNKTLLKLEKDWERWGSYSKNLTFNHHWIFQNKNKNLFVCLPKELAEHSELVLEQYGYNVCELEMIDLNATSPEWFENIDKETFQQSLTADLPRLFVNHEKTPKRFFFYGHGSTANSEKDGLYSGLKPFQFKEVFKKLEDVGMDFINCFSCHAAGPNLMKAFPKKRSAVVSLPSVGDATSRSMQGKPNDFIVLHPSNMRLCWHNLSALFCKTINQGKIEADDLKEVLLYSGVSGLLNQPIVSMPGDTHFQSVDVNNRTFILGPSHLLSLDNHNAIIKIPPGKHLVVLYSQMITAPLLLHKASIARIDRFPFIRSRIPGKDIALFEKIIAVKGTPEEVINDAFFSLFGFPSDVGQDWEDVMSVVLAEFYWEKIIFIRELEGRGEFSEPIVYRNVLIIRDEKDFFFLYQMAGKDNPPPWTLGIRKNGVFEMSSLGKETAKSIMIEAAERIYTSPKAFEYSIEKGIGVPSSEDVKKQFSEWALPSFSD